MSNVVFQMGMWGEVPVTSLHQPNPKEEEES